MLSPNIEGVTGKYFRNCALGRPRSDVNRVDWQSKLWDASLKLVKMTEDDPKI